MSDNKKLEYKKLQLQVFIRHVIKLRTREDLVFCWYISINYLKKRKIWQRFYNEFTIKLNQIYGPL